jgi:deoxyadenosine/deoxycytidine kinase
MPYMAAHVFLAVAGNIGSGKTTLTRRLSEHLGFQGLYESTADNPYLGDFYSDMQRWALPLQLRFLATRVEQTKAAQAGGVSVIQDRTCWEDAEIFAANLHARGPMDGRDYETYARIARLILSGIEPPDLLVYLCRSPESCRQQIARRGREYEQSMPPGYLEDLGARYDGWFDAWTLGPKMLVRAEEHDFQSSQADLDALVARITATLPQPLLPF